MSAKTRSRDIRWKRNSYQGYSKVEQADRLIQKQKKYVTLNPKDAAERLKKDLAERGILRLDDSMVM